MKRLLLLPLLALLACRPSPQPLADPARATLHYAVDGYNEGSPVGVHLELSPDGRGRLSLRSFGLTPAPSHPGQVGDFVGTASTEPTSAVETRLLVADGKPRLDLVGLGPQPFALAVLAPSDFLELRSASLTTTREDAARLAAEAHLPDGTAHLAAGQTLSFPLPSLPTGQVRLSFHALGPGKARTRAETEPLPAAPEATP